MIESLSAPYPYISLTLQMVHKDPFSSHLCLPTFPNPQPTNLTSRGTNTLPKIKVLHITTFDTLPTQKTQPSHPPQLLYSKQQPQKKKKKIKLIIMVPELVLWLWTVALHMCYWRRTLSLTTVDSWKTVVICEVVTPPRQDHVWSSPLAILLLQLRATGLLSLKIEWVISISVQNEICVGLSYPTSMSRLTKPPCIKITEIKIK